MKLNKKPSARIITAAIVVMVFILSVLIFGKPLFSFFSNPGRIESLVNNSGPWGPILFIVLQIAQVFFAPIPGQVTGFVGGYLFGTFLGTVYSIIGAAVGFTTVFWLSRKLGRPFVEYFVSKKVLEKFDYLAENQGIFILFLIFLLPAFPDDLICYIAGLTSIRIRTLVLISLVGRLPGYFVLSFTGSGVADSNYTLTAVVFGTTLVISALAFWQKEKLEKFVKSWAKDSK